MLPCPVNLSRFFIRLIPGTTAKVLLLAALWGLAAGSAWGQCTRQERFYARTQSTVTSGIAGNVANASLAADADPYTASTLSAAVLSSATQYLRFSEPIAAGKPATIKLSPPSGPLLALSNITIQAYSVNPVTSARTAVGDQLTSTTVLGLLSSSGTMELYFTPKSGAAPVAYQEIGITLGGVNVTTVSFNLFHAFVMKDAAADISCNEVVDYLYGIKAAGVDLATAASGVSSPERAVDGDVTTAAVMQAAATLTTPLYETVIFRTPSLPGDYLSIILEDPNVPLLSLTALGGFTVQPYLGQTPVGSPLTNTSSLLNLQLLSGGNGQQYVLTAPVAGSFDRLEIAVTGLVGLLRTLKIYEVSRMAPAPASAFTVNGQPGTDPVCITNVNNLRYNITGGESCAIYRWYNSSNTLLSSDVTFTPPITVPGTYTYYVAAQRTGCTNIETKKQITVTVSARPGPPVLTIQNNP